MTSRRIADGEDVQAGDIHGRTDGGNRPGRKALFAAGQKGYAAVMSTTAPAPAIPRSLFAYSIFYGGMVCIAGVLANKQVALGPLAVEAGIFAFLLLVVTSSAVAELFGRETANRLVLIGFAPLIFSILLAIFVLALPAAHDMPADRLAAFDTIMRGTPRIWIAGIIAYGISQFLNVTIFSALRGKGEGRVVWLRAGIAAVLSQIVDPCWSHHLFYECSRSPTPGGRCWPRLVSRSFWCRASRTCRSVRTPPRRARRAPTLICFRSLMALAVSAAIADTCLTFGTGRS